MTTNFPRTAEAGQIDAMGAPRSVTTILDTKSANGREYRLLMVSPGYEVAGSAMRWTDGYFAVRFTLDGARHGRRFKTSNQAHSLFDTIS